MTTHSTIYIDNDSVLRVQGLRDRSGALVANATVALDSFEDRRGADVTGISTPALFSNIGSGDYELSLPDSLGLVEGKVYLATVSAVSTVGDKAEWTETVIAKRRSA